ncbi:hypothetical protein F511_36226 [Dorcoceras hygrometricum]|uniref:J domain-containing protein n=1 Tax=Dorcoceras hygrometricum TaxID=472368 RepID=A0A2Z7A0J6_9LAMI|nr:hypothetical protein F511_36226 [Dorcoceras hygrometricum]
MDCNKGEAIRAKDIALKKMESGDFWGALRFAAKAQKLYSGVEDIEQMILVCEVHCSAEKTGHGNERDWFKILKCGRTADDDLIKKRYRGMALTLHPDKNKFPGAAGAFHLIREAKTVLLSQGTRRSHGSKLNSMSYEDVELEEWKSWISKEFPDGSWTHAGSSGCGLNEVKRSSPFEEMTNASKKRMGSSNGRVVGDNKDGNGVDDGGAKVVPKVKRSKKGGSCVASAIKFDTRGKGCDNNACNFKQESNEVKITTSFDEVRVLNERKNKGKVKENFGGSGSKGGNPAKCDFAANSGSGIAPEQNILEYSSPEFSDFEKERMKNCFKNGQVWASYDTLDAMPRFYALVNKIISEDFEIQITWLEPYSDNQEEQQWLYQGLPVSCGKFLLGETETIQDHAVFSHPVNFRTGIDGRNRSFYEIYPVSGETWAVFKNWDINWNGGSKGRVNLEFQLVEILSDYEIDSGIKVACLSKIKGFTSLFKRVHWKQANINSIPVKDIFRFSHKVPSIQMTGNEGPDVPKRCFELDPASLPLNNTGIPGFSSEPGAIKVLDSEFHDFSADKSPKNIKSGQIWAVYSDEDSLPKYYGLVKKVNTAPKLTLHVIWLIPSQQPDGSIGFLDKNMPISCGKFKHNKYKKGHNIDAAAISHQVKTETRNNEYYIFPRKGEVWALYRSWNSEMSRSELPKCKYDILEISEVNQNWVEAVVLEAVEGYKLVYRPQNEGQEMTRRQIEWHDVIKFSHRIPAFRLTGERGGALRGFWELDPAALPAYLFS